MPHVSADMHPLTRSARCASPPKEVLPRTPRIVALDDAASQRLLYLRGLLPRVAHDTSSCVLGATRAEADRVVLVVLGELAPDGTRVEGRPADVVILDQARR